MTEIPDTDFAFKAGLILLVMGFAHVAHRELVNGFVFGSLRQKSCPDNK